MNNLSYKKYLTYLFLLFISARLILFFTIYNNQRHSSSADFGSTAIGIIKDQSITLNDTEVCKISNSDIISADFLKFYNNNNRKNLTEFLPGPAVLLAVTWYIIPDHNYLPYILLQIIIDSMLLSIISLIFIRINKKIGIIFAILMITNIVLIKRTLMAGYDFWPQFSIYSSFILIYLGLKKDKSFFYILASIIISVSIWMRELVLFLPVFYFIILLLNFKKWGMKKFLKISLLYITPFIISVSILCLYRYNTTGDFRPTRSTFWHSFFTGVGQFSNPYNILPKDVSVWEFGKRLNPELNNYSLNEMTKSSNSLYELTLKKEAFSFIRENPEIFIRNIIYRGGIMISPVLYQDGDFIPTEYNKILYIPGILLIIIWINGMIKIFKDNKHLVLIFILIYLYFFAMFGWFYLVGRVILPFLFINIIVYLYGFFTIIEKMKKIKIHPSHKKI